MTIFDDALKKRFVGTKIVQSEVTTYDVMLILNSENGALLAIDFYTLTNAILNTSSFTNTLNSAVSVKMDKSNPTFSGPMVPTSDNTQSMGSASNRLKDIYAGTATINTSDERQKQQIEEIPETWLKAWGEVEYVRFKFNSAVEEKGDGARWHVGLIAQRIKAAFEKHGIDPFEIGLLCYDEWPDKFALVPVSVEPDETQGRVNADAEESEDSRPGQQIEMQRQLVAPAGNRYGVRYEQALALECAYLRWKLGA